MKYRYKIEGLDCPNCSAKLERMLADCGAFSSAKVNFLAERITVESDLDAAAAEARVREISAAFSKKLSITVF